MNTSSDIDPAVWQTLRTQLEIDPPPSLRGRLLGRHRRRRLLRRTAPALALVLTGALAFVAGHDDPALPLAADWQQQSAELEASWRAAGDPAWLRDDARAQLLLRRLRQVDHALGLSYALDNADTEQRNQLWRERSITLSALIQSRQQGGVAVVL